MRMVLSVIPDQLMATQCIGVGRMSACHCRSMRPSVQCRVMRHGYGVFRTGIQRQCFITARQQVGEVVLVEKSIFSIFVTLAIIVVRS
jgi:hypothetical protein